VSASPQLPDFLSDPDARLLASVVPPAELSTRLWRRLERSWCSGPMQAVAWLRRRGPVQRWGLAVVSTAGLVLALCDGVASSAATRAARDALAASRAELRIAAALCSRDAHAEEVDASAGSMSPPPPARSALRASTGLGEVGALRDGWGHRQTVLRQQAQPPRRVVY
jgi:hypothetical protein